MLLAIDAGNTNVVFALLQGREIRARWRIATDPRRTADEYVVWLNQLLMLEGYAVSDVDAVIIDEPAGFKGHGAGNDSPFARKFGACIQTFIETGVKQAPC